MAKKTDEAKYGPIIDLREIEEEALAEGREYTRRRIEEKLRQRAEAFFPGGGLHAPKRPTAKVDDPNDVR